MSIPSSTSHVRPTRVAIVGAGPAGTCLATLLARQGVSTVIFDDGKRPDLVVGESLVPLLVKIFQSLGIEDEVKALGVHKPGATFTIDAETAFELSFQAVRGVLPTYAYNVPRKEFDALMLRTAMTSGAHLLNAEARLEAVPVGNGQPATVRLAAESLALIPEWNNEPADLLVDASGRRRIFARLLGIEADVGPRKDVAHFAHFTGCRDPEPAGQIVISRLAHGWSWRIPLTEGRLSVGVVINKEAAKSYGATGEEVLNAVIERDPRLSRDCAARQRVTPVATYANYQLISHRGAGPGWAMVGDAFGFVDPMLSPGLCMAMQSAEKLAEAIPAQAHALEHAAAALDSYWRWFRRFLSAWQDLVDFFYDGRIFAIYKTGTGWSQRYPGKVAELMERHISKNLAGMAAGALVDRPYPRGLLRMLARFGIRDVSPADFAIR